MRFFYNETHVHDVVIKHDRSHRVLARKLMARSKTHALGMSVPKKKKKKNEEEEEEITFI